MNTENSKTNEPHRFKSDLWDFSDAYIVVKGYITITNPDNAKK